MYYTTHLNEQGYRNEGYGDRLDSYSDVKCGVYSTKSFNRPESQDHSNGYGSRREEGNRGNMTTNDGRYTNVTSMKDLKSPDSYDSGIQTDSIESNNWNMYGVVKKSKRFPSSNSDLQTNSMNEEEWGYYNDGDFHQTGNGRFAYSSNTIPDSNRKLSPMMENQNDDEDYDENEDDAFEDNDKPPFDVLERPSMHGSCQIQHKVPLRGRGIYSENEIDRIGSLTLENKTNRRINSDQNHRFLSQSELKTRSLQRLPASTGSTNTIQTLQTFAVSLLGSMPLTEIDMSAQNSVSSINHCIVQLSDQSKKKNKKFLENKTRMFLQIVGEQLVLIDAKTGVVVRKHLVKSIRNWGIGKEENSPTFGYVVRDVHDQGYTCWVFHSQVPANIIATALRNVCYRAVKMHSVNAAEVDQVNPAIQQKSSSSSDPDQRNAVYSAPMKQKTNFQQRPDTINEMDQQKIQNNNNYIANWPNPAALNETINSFCCRYLGLMKVPKAFGMTVLNSAMESIYKSIPPSKWLLVDVEVSTNAVVVVDHQNPESVIFDCRIRYLTFLGIAVNNPKLGAFIMHTADDEFFAHVFHCEPTAAVFSKLITSACNLRYQKCLEANPQRTQEMTDMTDHNKVPRIMNSQPGPNNTNRLYTANS